MPKILRLQPSLRPIPFAKRLYAEINRNNLFGVAAQLAYNFLFALFPFLLCLVALAAFLPVHGLVDRLLATFRAFMPSSVYKLVAHHLVSLVTQRHGELVTLGLILAIWSASNGIAALTTGLNLAYSVQETRPFWKTRGLAIGFTLGGGLAALIGITVLVLGGQAGDWISRQLGHPGLYTTTWSIVRWPISAALLMIVLALLYYSCPNVRMKFKYVTLGSVTSTLLWIASSLAFSFYVDKFGNYNATYGSIGTVVVLLTWLYLTGFILILGGQLNALVAVIDREGATLTPADGKEVGDVDRSRAELTEASRTFAAASAPPAAPDQKKAAPTPMVRPGWLPGGRAVVVPLVAILGMLGFLRMALNPIVEYETLQALSSAAGYFARLRGVTVSVSKLQYRLDGLALDRILPDGKPLPFVSLDGLNVALSWKDLLHGRLLTDIDLLRPKAWISVAAKPEAKQAPAPSRPVDWQARVHSFLPLTVQRLAIRDGEVDLSVALRHAPPMQLQLRSIEVVVENLNNRPSPDRPLPVQAALRASVGTSGRFVAEASVAPLALRPTFDLKAQLSDFHLPDLDRLVAAYSGIEFIHGSMALYLEATGRDGRIRGKARPLFTAVDVKSTAAPLTHPSVWKDLLADLAQAGIGVMENPTNAAVATTVPIHATVQGTKVNVWETLVGVVRNGFIEALPRAFPSFQPPSTRPASPTG